MTGCPTPLPPSQAQYAPPLSLFRRFTLTLPWHRAFLSSLFSATAFAQGPGSFLLVNPVDTFRVLSSLTFKNSGHYRPRPLRETLPVASARSEFSRVLGHPSVCFLGSSLCPPPTPLILPLPGVRQSLLSLCPQFTHSPT